MLLTSVVVSSPVTVACIPIKTEQRSVVFLVESPPTFGRSSIFVSNLCGWVKKGRSSEAVLKGRVHHQTYGCCRIKKEKGCILVWSVYVHARGRRQDSLRGNGMKSTYDEGDSGAFFSGITDLQLSHSTHSMYDLY